MTDLDRILKRLHTALADGRYAEARRELEVFSTLARKLASAAASPADRTALAHTALGGLKVARQLALANKERCATELDALARVVRYLPSGEPTGAISIAG